MVRNVISWLLDVKIFPSVLFFIMAVSVGMEWSHSSNIHKTALVYVSVTLVFFVSILLMRWKETPPICWKWGGWLLLPLVSLIPGYYISGGEVNYALRHEVAVHLSLVLWLVCFVYILSDESGIKKFLYFLSGAIVYVVFVGVSGVDLFSNDVNVLQKSTFGNQNLFSNFLILFLPLILLMGVPIFESGKVLDWSKFGIKNSWFLLVFIVGVMGLVKAETRSAVVGFVGVLLLGGGVIYLLSGQRSRKSIYLVGSVLLLIIFLIPFVYYFYVSQLDEIAVRQSRFLNLLTWQAWAGRLLPWQVAWESILNAPWFGYGPGSSFNLFFRHMPPDLRLYVQNENYDHVHNEWLEVAQEGGVLGVLILFGVYLLVFRMGFSLLVNENAGVMEKKVVLGAMLGMVAYLFHGTFSISTRMTFNELAFFTVIGLLIIYYRKVDQGGRSLLLSFFLGVGVVTIIWASGLQELQRDYDNKHITLESVRGGYSQVEKYIDSESVSTLHMLALRQMKSGDLYGVDEALDQIEEHIRDYNNVHMMRAIAYMMSAEEKVDILHFKKMLLKHWERDNYHRPVLHWLARIAALEGKQEEVLFRIRLLFQSVIFSERLLPYSQINQVKVQLHEQLDGIAIEVSGSGMVLYLGKEVFVRLVNKLMRDSSAEEADQYAQELIEKVYIKSDPSYGVAVSKVKQVFLDLTALLAGWTKVPRL